MTNYPCEIKLQNNMVCSHWWWQVMLPFNPTQPIKNNGYKAYYSPSFYLVDKGLMEEYKIWLQAYINKIVEQYDKLPLRVSNN